MIRRVAASAPIQWLIQAANAGVRNPRVLLLGAMSAVMTFLVALLIAGIAFGAIMRLVHGGEPEVDAKAIMLASIPLMLCAMMVPQLLVGGLSHLIHRIETTGQARIADVYASLRKDRFLPLSVLLVIPVANLVLTLLFYSMFGGENYFEDYIAAMQKIASGQMVTPPEPDHAIVLTVATLALNALTYSLQLFAPIQVMLGGRGGFAAIGDCVRAFLRNIPAMLVGCALGFLVLFGIAMLLAVVLLLAAMLTKIAPLLGSLVALVLLSVFAVIGVLFWVSCGYFGWRAMLGDQVAAAPGAGIAM